MQYCIFQKKTLVIVCLKVRPTKARILVKLWVLCMWLNLSIPLKKKSASMALYQAAESQPQYQQF